MFVCNGVVAQTGARLLKFIKRTRLFDSYSTVVFDPRITSFVANTF